jgi:integrase
MPPPGGRQKARDKNKCYASVHNFSPKNPEVSMNGCRALSEHEVKAITGRLESLRDKLLFVLGVKSGFRISELLSLRVGDVIQYGQAVERVSVARQHMKKQVAGRTVVLHPDARALIIDYATQACLSAGDYLFKSAKGRNRPITRVQAWRILKDAYEAERMPGKVATHSMRKTFASRVYDRLGKDLVKTQKALGHKNINSTVSYLAFRQEEIDNAILES